MKTKDIEKKFKPGDALALGSSSNLYYLGWRSAARPREVVYVDTGKYVKCRPPHQSYYISSFGQRTVVAIAKLVGTRWMADVAQPSQVLMGWDEWKEIEAGFIKRWEQEREEASKSRESYLLTLRSVKDMAEGLGLDPSQIASHQNGQVKISVDMLEAILKHAV